MIMWCWMQQIEVRRVFFFIIINPVFLVIINNHPVFIWSSLYRGRRAAWIRTLAFITVTRWGGKTKFMKVSWEYMTRSLKRVFVSKTVITLFWRVFWKSAVFGQIFFLQDDVKIQCHNFFKQKLLRDICTWLGGKRFIFCLLALY